MGLNAGSIIKKGYTPLALNKYAALSWQGEYLGDFWMWNRQFIDTAGGRGVQTVRVTDLKEAALRVWRDRWVPLVLDEGLLERMEAALRGHKGLKSAGFSFPDTSFLTVDALPERERASAPQVRP